MTFDAGNASGAGDQQEEHRLHREQPVGRGPFPRSILRSGKAGVKLKGAHQIVGHHAELLPCTVRGIMVGRDHVEGEIGL
jgi:hypothetical protein